MEINLQPYLENELVELTPLKPADFEMLFEVASDPLIWEQHPDKHRYKKEEFEKYFLTAIESKGAFLIYAKTNGELIGCSRYYDHDEKNKQIAIGYTFLARKCWGRSYNQDLKKLMIDYAFTFVETVLFHIGTNNLRSRKAIEKIGAKLKTQEENSVVYVIEKKNWSN